MILFVLASAGTRKYLICMKNFFKGLVEIRKQLTIFAAPK